MIATSEEMKNMDQRAVEEYGITMRQLMKQAADALFETLYAQYGTRPNYVIFCGSGNNGGDGYALALRMIENNMHVQICALCSPNSECANYYAQQVLERGEKILDGTYWKQAIQDGDILIDALLGTGLNRVPQGEYARVIQALNASGKTIVAVDVPSGLGEQSFSYEHTVHANQTITFECIKKGMLPYSRRLCCGEILLVSIGIPSKARQCRDRSIVLDARLVGELLPKRKAQSHKSSYGRVLVIGGSKQMSGALVLCTKALLRSGAGLVTCMLPSCIHMIVAAQLKEAMFRVMPDDGNQFVSEYFCSIDDLRAYDLIVIGNGMGRGNETKKIVERVLASDVPCILDGDAIYEAGKHDLLDINRTAQVIITPHLKELSYLLKQSFDQLREEPWLAAEDWLKEHPFVTAVIKDDITWVLHQEERALNIIGNNGLAKGGSGDVLCGVIAGFYAQSRNAFDSACAGVYAHAFSADQLIQVMDPMGMLPSDLIEQLPKTYQELRRKAFFD